MFERDDENSEREYSTRDALVAAFEAFDAGTLTAENAHTLELPKDTEAAKDQSNGAAAGANAQGAGGTQQERKSPAGDPASATQQDNSRDSRRDPATGRFAKGEGEGERKPAAADPASQQQAKPDQQQQQPATPPQDEKPAGQAQPEPAPQGMSDKAAAIWGNASPEARAYIAETEGVLAKISDGVKPLFETAKEHGLHGFEYAQRLVNADKYLRRDPMNAMLWLMETHKIDPEALADMAAAKRAGIQIPQPNGQQQPDQNFNPAIQSLTTQVQELTSKLTQREQAEQQQAQDAANARKAAVRQQFDAFTADKAKAPYWKEVESAALAFIPAVQRVQPQASVSDVLAKAYELACNENPTVRAKIDAERNRQRQQQDRHTRARDLQSMTDHRGAPLPKTTANGHDKSLRDEIAANWDAFDNR
jgi:hypothetical protein